MKLNIYVGFCPRPVTVVKDLPFGLIGASYYPPFGTVAGWGQFPIYTHQSQINPKLIIYPVAVQDFGGIPFSYQASGTFGTACIQHEISAMA